MKFLRIALITTIGIMITGCVSQIRHKYTVTFWVDDEIISTQVIYEGRNAKAPDNPIKEGYEFMGWDQDFKKVTQNLTIKANFLKIEDTYHEVIFYDDLETIIQRAYIKDGESATPPISPLKPGYIFIRWDQDFDVVTSDLAIRPIFEKLEIDPKRAQYTSYIKNITFNHMEASNNLVNQINFQTDLVHTINNIYYGGFRGADQMHYYDASNLISRNLYGFEIAIDASGIVIQKGTIVDLPSGGFILSGHSSTATFLQNNILIGDVVRYQSPLKKAECFRNLSISSTIGLGIEINDMKPKITNAFNNVRALDYNLINEKINETIDLYNRLLLDYQHSDYLKAKELLVNLDFLLIEGSAVETKAFWHYPLRSGIYNENNLFEVRLFLNQIKLMGFNRIYLNTNFGGNAVYQSEYLKQVLSASNTYSGYKDYLECFISEAHALDIEVFAWTNTLIAGDGYLSDWYRLRGWITRGYNNEDNFNGMYFLDISNPDVQIFIKNVYRELASNYALDGIEYDFIRYPNNNIYNKSGKISDAINDSGYTTTFMNAFREYYPFEGDFKEAIKNSEIIRNAWLTFKKDTLNDTVQMLSTTIKTARPAIKISAAVMPSISTARNVYLQDWDYWLNMGWVDILDPMIYTANNDNLVSSLTSMKNLVANRAEIIAGIFPEGSGGPAGMNAEQINLIKQIGLSGYSKFSSKTIFANQALVNSFSYSVRKYTVTHLATNAMIFHAYLYDLLDKIEYYYQFVDGNTDYLGLLNLLEDYYVNEDANLNYLNAMIEIESEITKINHTIIKNRLLLNSNKIKTYLQ